MIVATVGEAQQGNSISNTAAVASPVFDPDLSNNTDSVTVGVPPEADLAVVKTAVPDPVEAGPDPTYTLTVTNNGPNAATDTEVNRRPAGLADPGLGYPQAGHLHPDRSGGL